MPCAPHETPRHFASDAPPGRAPHARSIGGCLADHRPEWGAVPALATGPDAADAPGPSVLMDLRPCYEGFAGIPQEARLLFAMFSGFKLRRFAGLASGIHFTSRRASQRTPFERVLAQT